MPKLNQRGIVPIILIIILTVVVAGVSGAVYNSRKEIKVRKDNTSEVTELKNSPSPTPKNADVALDQSGRLSDKPFKAETTDSTSSGDSSMPGYSFYPPAGWNEDPVSGNVVAEFVSPTQDKIEEGATWFKLAPNVAVFVLKEEFSSLDEAFETAKSDLTKSGFQMIQTKKTKLNGEDAYFTEAILNIGEVGKDALSGQIKQEAVKSGEKFSEKQLQKDVDALLKQLKARVIGYIFYKNGYLMTVSGKALDSFWDKRGSQIKRSLDSFKFN